MLIVTGQPPGRPQPAVDAAKQAKPVDTARQVQQQRSAADAGQAAKRTADVQNAAKAAADAQRTRTAQQHQRAADTQARRTLDARTAARTAADRQRGPADRYSRPTYFRQGVPETVWNRAIEAKTGQVRDPTTGRFLSPNKAWDMGHKPGHEFWKHQESARDRQISRAKFLDEHNNSERYRPEDPSSNRSRRGEDRTSTWLGP